MKIRTSLPVLLLMAGAVVAGGNTAPTPVINSATMRAGTTLLDVSFRVNDPDDATVKVRALAFIDGTRSFAKVIKPASFVEGTGSKLGDAITANTNHTLTWDVGADWATDVGQLKFEILALDGRGLLAFDWITIPAASGRPELTISKDAPAADKMLDALFWDYAGPSPHCTLSSGTLRGNSSSGVYAGIVLAVDSWVAADTPGFLLKLMNLDPASPSETGYAATTARANLLNTGGWHAVNRSYAGGIQVPLGWGSNSSGELSLPATFGAFRRLSGGGMHTLAITISGTVGGVGVNWNNQLSAPSGLTDVTAIAAGYRHSLALKSDGTVAAWGDNGNGQISVPSGLTGATSIAAGYNHSLAVKSDGTVVGWGSNSHGQVIPPSGLTDVTTVAAGYYHSLALKSDGTVVGWGNNGYGQASVPVGLTGVTAIAAGHYHSLALKGDGTVVAWGYNANGQTSVPAGLSGVTAIAAGSNHSVALKSDGTVVAWGSNSNGQVTVPAGLTDVTAIAAGGYFTLVLKAEPQ